MTITASNVLGGAAELYHGDFGAVEPLSTAVTDALDPLVWTDFGATSGGLNKTVERDFYDLTADQVPEPLGTRLINKVTTLSTSLAEITLENLARAWGDDPDDITTGGTGPTAYKELVPAAIDPGEEPNYHALILRGWGPNRKRRLVILRKVLSVASVGTEYKRDGQTFIPVNFKCFWVSASLRPIRIIDSAAS